ncbi:MAG: hypothetical protein GY727_15100, partial [Gammaproteobacteria bacterium]|nr:hypothetical protein [Gammaproteobacteria bacterium]
MKNLRTFLSHISIFQIVILITLLTVSFSSTNAWGQSVTRGPYLQSGTPTSIVVRWRTDVDTDSIVYYGDVPNNLIYNASLSANTTEHEIALTGLTPDTVYYYSIGTTTATLAGGDNDHYFVTAPSFGTAKSTRVWILGDSGTAGVDAAAVRDAYISFTGTKPTDVWLMLGDNAYPSGTDIQYQNAL